MAATTNTTTPTPDGGAIVPSSTAEEMAAKAVHKRYEGLLMVRNKAIKGKGAWYWAHLEPLVVHNEETGLSKAVKLRCSLCDAVFSASNPSRTASEHLKRGTCPNFISQVPKPISSISSPSSTGTTTPPSAHPSNRKRTSSSSSPYPVSAVASSSFASQINPLAIIDPARYHQTQLVLSGGKDDLGALALLEDRVKKLKSPKTSPTPTLSKTQIESALEYLTDWFYESCGSLSFSTFDHPKFRAFLTQVGLPCLSRRELSGSRLDLKFEEAKIESEERIRDAMFFQIASDGWRTTSYGEFGDMGLVNLTVNLPNGTSVYRRAVFLSGSVPPKYAEEVMWETITGICGNYVHQCVGIVADRFKYKALKNLENQHHWMVNLCCQSQGISRLLKDFSKGLSSVRSATENCFKLAQFFNHKTPMRISFLKYQLQEHGFNGLFRIPTKEHQNGNFLPVLNLIEDVLSSSGALQMAIMDESYKIVASEEAELAREVAEMIRDVGFWNQLEAVHSLLTLVKQMAQQVELERPLVGQCLPLWEELRGKVKEWRLKFHISEGPVEKMIEKRFKKNYHPAWAAAYVLDPLYLVRDASGKYLPPFKNLTREQEKDVDKLITRLVSREEAHIVLMELMKWRTEGLDPDYAKAVQMKERDSTSGKMKSANPQSSRLVWETYLTEFKSLGRVAVRLIFLHATSCGFKCNWSLLKWVCSQGRSRSAMDKAQKLIFIGAHSKLNRREFVSDEDRDAEFVSMSSGDDDVLNEVFVDTSSV